MKLNLATKVKDLVRPVAFKAAPLVGLVKRKSPEILLAAGIFSIGAGTVTACRATLKAKDAIEDGISKAEQLMEDGEEPSAVRMSYLQTAGSVAAKYALPATLIGTGVACIVVSHNIQSKRILAAVASLDALQVTFDEYRKRVVTEHGADADKRYLEAIRYEKATFYEEDPETGKVKKVRKEVPVTNNLGSPYAITFDGYSCPTTFKDEDYRNRDFIERMQVICNQKLKAQGYLFLSDVYDALGHEYKPIGQFTGWMMDWCVKPDFLDKWDGDQCVTFFVNQYYDDDELAFAEAEKRNPVPLTVIDFNVDGEIWDKMKIA